MAIFASSVYTQTATVTNSATLIFDADPANSVAGSVIGDVTVINTGSTTIFLGQSTVTASTGLRCPAGAQVTINGFGAKQSSTTFDIYAITSSGTSTTLSGPATLDPVV